MAPSQDALEISRRLTALHPQAKQTQADVALALVELGAIKLELDQADDALAEYREALVIDDAQRRNLLRKPSWSQNSRWGTAPAPLAEFNVLLEVALAGQKRNPGRQIASAQVARRWGTLGDAKKALGDPKGSQEAYSNALTAWRKIAADDP